MRYTGIVANTPGSPDALTAMPDAKTPLNQPTQSPGCVLATVERKMEAMREKRFAGVQDAQQKAERAGKTSMPMLDEAGLRNATVERTCSVKQ
jgi:ethanolamine ammonia-lyase large subunit